MIAWIIAHGAGILAVILAIVRVLESIAVILKDGKAKTMIKKIIATVKEFFHFS